jgi:hypothetical protein
MENEIQFSAPWGRLLKIITSGSVALLLCISLIGVFTGPRDENRILWRIMMVDLPLAILFISTLFLINGYILTKNTLYIQRPLWDTKIDLSDLITAEFDPTATAKAIRVFGNGGMFCFAGLFHNKRLGTFRAFATDMKKSVIMRFPHRTIVVTPDDPTKFVLYVTEVKERKNLK